MQVKLAMLITMAALGKSQDLTPQDLYKQDGTRGPGGKFEAPPAGGVPKRAEPTNASPAPPRPLRHRVSTTGAVGKRAQASSIPKDVTQFTVSYEIVIQTPGGLKKVGTDHDFHTGDEYYIDLTSNLPAYVYLFQKEPDGKFSWLIPGDRFPAGHNRLDRGHTRLPQLEGKQQLYFSLKLPAGLETLFLISSAEKIPEIEALFVSRKQPDSVLRAMPASAFRDAPPPQPSGDRVRSTVIAEHVKKEDVLLYQPAEGTNYITLFSLHPDAVMCWKIVLKHVG